MLLQDSKIADLSIWLRTFAELFRHGWAEMTEEERGFVGSLDDFSPPCQIDVIWFAPPDMQYLVGTHFEDRPDLEIRVTGPHSTYRSVEQLESLLGESRWDRPIPPGDGETSPFFLAQNAKEAVESFFLGILEDIRGSPFREPPEKSIIASKASLFPGIFGWYIRGDIRKLSPSVVAREIIESAKRQAQFYRNAPRPAPPPERKPWLKGHGGFVFPPVWIGDPPKPTLREKMGGWPLFSKKALETTFKGKPLIVDQDGFIAIAESDRLTATDLLNEIMATRLLDGKPVSALGEREVTELAIDPDTKQIGGRATPWASTRNSLQDVGSWSYFFFMLGREVVPPAEFLKWISRAEKLAEDPEASDMIRFLLEAFTHFENSRYAEAFVLSWVIIEKHVYSIWRLYLKSRKFPEKRRTADLVVEELSLAGKLSTEEYRRLEEMRDLRNSIVHKGQRVSKEEADRALEAAMGSVKHKLGLPV